MKPIDRRFFLTGAGASAALPFAAQAQSPADGWAARASLPWAVQEIYCAVSGGRIVMAGGLRRPARVTEIEDRTGIYDPATDVWTEGPRLPAARHHPMLMAGPDGTVFALGGYGRS